MQITTATLILAALSQSVLADYNRDYAPLTVSSRRSENSRRLLASRQQEALTCPDTYGPGSMACGSTLLRFCFNPTAGESCCSNDGGFCKAGWHCAPVASFCCKDGEDLATCAKNAGFQLPSSVYPIESPPTSSITSSRSAASTSAAATVSSSSARSQSATVLPITAAASTLTEDCDDGMLTQLVPVALTSTTTSSSAANTTAAATTSRPVSQQTISPAAVPTLSVSDLALSFQTTTAVPTIAQVAQPSSNYTLPALVTPQVFPVPTATTSQPGAASSSVRPAVQIARAGPSRGGDAQHGWGYILAAGAVMVGMAL